MAATGPIVVVAGNIATGKTSLVETLADALDLSKFPERWEENPWFGAPPQHAFAAQLWFLISSSADQATALASGGGVLERSLHEHALIFAREQLTGEEAKALEHAYALLESSLADPQLLVYLRASPAELLSRVRARGRTQEKQMTLERLERLDAAYRQMIDRWTRSPLLEIDTQRVDVRSTDGAKQAAELARQRLTTGGES